ncbi:inositol monophosphatase family protein [Devosia faecipullorum]|uniref:inositol monophosphatase family protein n=1 Tax=Devosia faecipullorum TaxID=2755039 RepID=UPI00187B7C65|nr:inositol monophosphatase family protein [Devosia faecipullorum]MBE7731984.1 inositol monophosphatase [Devosia faecipullorum]
MTLDALAIDRRETFLALMVQEAAIIALEGFRRQSGETIGLKGPQDYLTETDGQVEDFVRSRIAEAFPEDGFLGEEGGGTPGRQAWIVDPIDGTANFARSIPHFCIAIAFVAGGLVQLGTIINPALDETYAARLGRGATLNGRPIRVSEISAIEASSVEMGWSGRRPLAQYLRAIEDLFAAGTNVRRSSCGALGLAYVADGRSDGYAELHMNPWDCLAGLLLVREAGGVTGAFLSVDGLAHGAPVLAAAPGVAELMSRATGIALQQEPDFLPDAACRQRRTA